MRGRFLWPVVVMVGLAVSGAGAAQGDGALDLPIRVRAYVADYEPLIGSVVADEEFVQFIRTGATSRRRRLVSEVGFLRLPGDLDWIGHRSVRTVDGRRVRVDARPLHEILSQGGASLREQAMAIAAENAQFNLGFPRTINLESPGPSKVENQITVEFEPDPEVGFLVPTKMTEVFYSGGYGSGEAVYRRFKRFATAARIVPQP